MLKDFLNKRLELRKKAGCFRRKTVWEGKAGLNFSSNDYLGLANHPEVVFSGMDGFKKYGVGSKASQLLGGYSFAHQGLEEELADFLGYEQVMLFSAGYLANLGVISALFDERDHSLFLDRLCHASIIDGVRRVKAHYRRYQHLDLQDLVKCLKLENSKDKIIISEGVFSMNGDLVPLPGLVSIAKKNNSLLMLDDAHGVGVLGANGKGVMEFFGVRSREVPILIGTFGKAFGTFGAFVAGSQTIIESLIQFARTYIYTTALPVAIVEATRTSLKLLQAEGWRRVYLQELIKEFKQKADQLGLQFLPSVTPIQPFIIGDIKHAARAALFLKRKGILVGLIRPPTVPINTTRLRITLTANHTKQDVDFLLATLSKAIKNR